MIAKFVVKKVVFKAGSQQIAAQVVARATLRTGGKVEGGASATTIPPGDHHPILTKVGVAVPEISRCSV